MDAPALDRMPGVDRRGATTVEYAVGIDVPGLAIAAGFATRSMKLMAKVGVLPL